MRKIKILEVSGFSAGICGVWTRVRNESERLSKLGYEIRVFTSNIKRGSGKIEYAPTNDKLGDIKIKRFKTKGNFGENTYFWNFSKDAIEYSPDIIICHVYRQYFSTQALKIAKKLNIPCILVTHAPFLEKKLRSRKLNTAVWIYDKFIGKKILNNYSKIFTITKWEVPSLKKLGVKENKIIYVPNGIPEDFFNIKILKTKIKKEKEILFLGRIAPIKDIETLLKALSLIKKENKNIKLNLVGPIEENYKKILDRLINKLKIKDLVKFSPAVFDIKEKIKIMDNSDIYVLPSKREGMPQSLIEAMSREKIVITSDCEGGKELVQENNGYIFKVGSSQDLAKKILEGLINSKENKKIRENARNSVKKFSWDVLIKRIDSILKQEVKKNESINK